MPMHSKMNAASLSKTSMPMSPSQAISLLAADGIGCDYARLLDDLSRWLNSAGDPSLLRQRWARDFYRAAQAPHDSTDSE